MKTTQFTLQIPQNAVSALLEIFGSEGLTKPFQSGDPYRPHETEVRLLLVKHAPSPSEPPKVSGTFDCEFLALYETRGEFPSSEEVLIRGICIGWVSTVSWGILADIPSTPCPPKQGNHLHYR